MTRLPRIRFTPRLHRIFGFIFLFLLTATVLSAQPIVADTSFEVVVSHAYSLLRVSSPEAVHYFERAVEMAPADVLLRRQLGYIYYDEGKLEAALQQFESAQALAASDTIKLQIAYTLDAMERSEEADSVFRELESSSIPHIRKVALRSRASDPSSLVSEANWWTHFYAVSYYDTRWNTTFFQSYLERGYDLSNNVALYGVAMYSGDARSSGGQAPAIFSDNALILGLGVRVKPSTILSLSVQQGLAFDIVDRAAREPIRGDFRAVGVLSTGIYAKYERHSHFQMPFRPFADFYSSFGYYSRYDNGIGYFQGRAGVRVVEVNHTVGDLYLRGDLVRDIENDFYNNQIEGGIGARLTPNVNWGLHLVGEVRRGHYIDVGSRIPYDRYFNSFRLYLIIDRKF